MNRARVVLVLAAVAAFFLLENRIRAAFETLRLRMQG